MISQIYRLLLNISLISFFSFAIVLGIAVDHSWAITPFTRLTGSPPIQIATMDRGKAFTKNLEGKAQEAIGNVTGDPQDQITGKAKQAEAGVRNMLEDAKDSVRVPERAKATAKNLEGKAQEAIGNVTGDSKNQIAGKAKQAEANGRNIFEDVTETVKGLFD